MRIKDILVATPLLLGLAPSAALAIDFFDGVKRLEGQTFAVTAVCDKTYSSYTTVKDVDGDQSMQVEPPETSNPAWDAVLDSCNKTKASFSIAVKLKMDDRGNVQAVFDDAASPDQAGTIADLTKRLIAEMKDVDSITGFADRKNQALEYAGISQAEEEPGMLVFFSDMAPRRTVDYLATCFETCDRATFKLGPVKIYKSDIRFFLGAIDWSLPSKDVRPDAPPVQSGSSTRP